MLGHVGLDVDFGDIYKNERGRHEGKLERNDLYFDRLNLGSECSDEDGDLVENDGVIEAPRRNSSCKVYFDPKNKNVLFQLYMIFVNHIEFRETLQNYSIKKGMNLKLKPNKKETIKKNCKSLIRKIVHGIF